MRTCKATTRILFLLLFATGVAATPASANKGFWISDAEIAQLPMSGSGWSSLKSAADGSAGTPDLANQDDPTNVKIFAKALVYARTHDTQYRDGVVAAIRSIVNSGSYSGRALALGREIGTYAIAADLISLQSADPALDTQFRAKIKQLLTASTSSGPQNLIVCHEDRPNNWGAHCGASRIAIDLYLGDNADVGRAAQVLRGWLGDRSSYSGFTFHELDWQADPSKPVGINPKGATKLGHSIDGVLPDDERRAGGFEWPPPKENYVYEALQGIVAQGILLSRAGYDVWNWQDKAMLRAFQWLHNECSFPATGDDTWEPHVINHFYGTSFPAPVPSSTGKAYGYTEWTLSSKSVDGCPKCGDGVQNCNESDTDCGQFCARCALGKKCGVDADCASGQCTGGLCVVSQDPCKNGTRDNGESDIDCGGPCTKCANGKSCGANSDCKSGVCQGGQCVAAAPTCSDGFKNQDETDVDCGGATCPHCADGDHCALASDCLSGQCSRNVCVNTSVGTCSDNELNQDESDVDCGGTKCPTCTNGLNCGNDADCASDLCERHTCVALPAPVLLDARPMPNTP